MDGRGNGNLKFLFWCNGCLVSFFCFRFLCWEEISSFPSPFLSVIWRCLSSLPQKRKEEKQNKFDWWLVVGIYCSQFWLHVRCVPNSWHHIGPKLFYFSLTKYHVLLLSYRLKTTCIYPLRLGNKALSNI